MIWIETGGTCNPPEVYGADDTPVRTFDWDEWNEPQRGAYTPDDVFAWLEEYGHVMPRRTRRLLLETLMPDPAYWEGTI